VKPLNPRTALRCEQAITERCRCRCNGVLHGARRVGSREALATLDEADPHFVHPDRLRSTERPPRPLIGVQTTIDPSVPERPIYGRRWP
jgi:hypothetical protein